MSEFGGRSSDSACNVPNVTDLKRLLDAPTGLWLFGLRVAAFVGSLSIGGAILWYFYLYRTSPRSLDQATGHIVPMSEHGASFYIQESDDLVLKALIAAIALLFAPTMWLEIRGKGLRNELPSPRWDELRKQGIDAEFLKGRRSKHDIFTVPVTTAMIASVVMPSGAIATGGYVPFGVFGL